MYFSWEFHTVVPTAAEVSPWIPVWPLYILQHLEWILNSLPRRGEGSLCGELNRLRSLNGFVVVSQKNAAADVRARCLYLSLSSVRTLWQCFVDFVMSTCILVSASDRQ